MATLEEVNTTVGMFLVRGSDFNCRRTWRPPMLGRPKSSRISLGRDACQRAKRLAAEMYSSALAPSVTCSVLCASPPCSSARRVSLAWTASSSTKRISAARSVGGGGSVVGRSSILEFGFWCLVLLLMVFLQGLHGVTVLAQSGDAVGRGPGAAEGGHDG